MTIRSQPKGDIHTTDLILFHLDGSTTWLPMNPNYEEVNVAAQFKAKESHLKTYIQLASLRKDERVKTGETTTMVVDSVFAFSRWALIISVRSSEGN